MVGKWADEAAQGLALQSFRYLGTSRRASELVNYPEEDHPLPSVSRQETEDKTVPGLLPGSAKSIRV